MTHDLKPECPRCGLINGHRYPCTDDSHDNYAVTPAALPVLSEGATYQLEITSQERVRRATLLKIVDDAALGRGFSFQIGRVRKFIYERDLIPGPRPGYLIATV